MQKVYNSFPELIGRTPIVRLNRIENEFSNGAMLYAKLEYFNPAGSIKDRAALSMIEAAIKSGALKEGGAIIEPTSGNTGIGIAAISASLGYKAIIVMPDTMSVERQKIIRAYGAEVVLTDGTLGMAGAIAKAEELHKELDGSIIAGQFTNEANPLAHYNTTAKEIFDDMNGEIDILVSCVGTGGTISGCAKFLKEKNPDIRVVAVEPTGSPYLSKGIAGPHKIQGIGAGFIPEILDTGAYDEIITITDDEAYDATRLIARYEGYLVGISSGAAISAAIKLSKRDENRGKKIVVILPDTGERYLSTNLFI